MKRGRAQSAAAFAALVSLGGCASIISGRQAEVTFDGHPSNAHVVIRDNEGREVASLQTPGVVSLKRNCRFFMPARYTADIVAPGYQAAHVPIRSSINPWILGNVVVGGIPGLIVDTATGAAWMPRPSTIHQELTPLDGSPPDPYDSVGAARHHESVNAVKYVADESSLTTIERR